MKAKITKAKLGFLLAFILMLSFGNLAFAATVTFDGSTDNDWNDATNWTPAQIPTAADDAIIPDGFAVTLSGGGAALTVTINGTSTLNLNGQDLDVAQNGAGHVTINSTSATAFIGGVGNLTIGSASYKGDLINASTGTVNLTGTTVSISGNITNNGGGTLTTTATTNLTLVGTTSTTLPDDITNLLNLTITKTGATASLGATTTLAGALSVTSGIFNMSDYGLTVGTTTSVYTGATVTGTTTETVSRIFTGAVTMNGTASLTSSGEGVTNDFQSTVDLGEDIGIEGDAAGTVLSLTNCLLVDFGGTITGASASTINLNGSTVDFSAAGGALTFANITVNANSNTSIDFGNGTAVTFPTSISELQDLTISAANAVTLGADLTISGNLSVTNNGLVIGANTLTVNGSLGMAGGTINATGSTVVLNGIANFTGATAFTTTNATTLTFGGTGAITAFPTAAPQTLKSFTYNRPGETLTLLAAGTLATTGGATPTINITSGTVTFAANNQLVDDANTTTTIGANGTLDFVTFLNTFLGTVTGTGTVDATTVGTTGIVFSGPYTFTGDLLTTNATFLTFDTDNSDVELNSSVTALNTLTFDRAGDVLTLNSDITIAGNITEAEFANGTIEVNGYNLAFNAGLAYGGAGAEIDATNSSTISFTTNGSTIDLTNDPITFDQTTNVITEEDITLVADLTINNLEISSTAIVDAGGAGDLITYGNLDIQTGCELILSAGDDLTVYGNMSVDGTLTAGSVASTITLYGSLEGEGNYTTDETTTLVVNGTGSQLVMPSSLAGVVGSSNAALGILTLNRPNGMKLNADLTIGETNAGTADLVITAGNLDLNGYVIELNDVNGVITETAGYRIINTGATGPSNGYITTETANGTSTANLLLSNIGTEGLSVDAGADWIVRRYPITVPVSGVGLSTSRYYYIDQVAASDNVTAVTLEYDNTELNSDASSLKLYYADNNAFSSATEVDGTNNTNTPTGKGNIAVTGISVAYGNYYVAAGLPSSGGVMRTFAAASGEWSDDASWSPSGVPTAIDQVVIGPSTVTISGNGQTFYASDILMNHASATLQPNTNGVDGDEVTLVVNGEIEMTAAGSEIKGVNGTGRLNIQIGDGTTAGVASTITTQQNYNGNAGFSANDLIINGAALDFSGGDQIRIYGDLQLVGNASADASGADVVFYGGSNATQNIDVASSAFLSFGKVITENNANVATSDFIEINDEILVKANTDFRMSGGTASFPDATGNGWTVEVGGDLYLFNVELTATGNTYTPSGTVYVQGDLTKSGTSAFQPTSGTVVFANTGLRDLVNSGAGALEFFNIEVQAGSSVRTSSSFIIANNIDVKTNASFVGNSGTITMGGTNSDGLSEIMNVSTQTLEFFNLVISQPTTTSDSWKIKGNLTVSAGGDELIANDGTITFENTQEKTIANSGTDENALIFFNLAVANNSSVTSSTGFTIANNSTNLDDAGLTTVGNGSFEHTGTLYFDARVGVTEGHPKVISKSTSGTIEISTFNINASPNNEVTTATDLTITGSFVNSGAGGNFNATGGAVIFNAGGTTAIESYSPAVTSFYGVTSSGTTQLEVFDAHEIYIKGDLTVNDATSFSPQDGDSKVIFNGTAQQTIGGNSSLPDFIEFGRLQINKGSGTTTTADEVLMEAPVLVTGAGSQLVLTNGVLNLGSETLTNGAPTISRLNGVINGGTGTYVVTTGHQGSLLNDNYFTVDGEPTLYNLTVNLLHTTTGDLTVNGAIVLGSGNLTVGAGASQDDAIKLNLLGNVSRVSGVFDGDEENSTIVFGGTGTVSGGLSNSYFTGSTSTANLVFNRAETLGGDLDITAATDLEIGTGVNSLNLGANTLTFAATSTITMVSGGITAGIGSSVVFPNDITEIPASMFRDNEVNNVTFAVAMTLLGDLTINGIWTGAFNVTTGDNVLTIGENATLPTFTTTAHVIGNLQRTVTSTATVFNVGDGTADGYIPLSLQFATAGSEQLVTVSPSFVDPTIGRGGNPLNSVNAIWTIAQDGTTPLDSLQAIFTWNANVEQAAGGGQVVSAGSFPAKWNGVNWDDYRNNVASVNTTTYVLTQSSSPIMASDLAGSWAIFNPDANTDAAKDAAISLTSNKVVITSVTPTPIGISEALNVTVQLQDQFGQPVQAAETFEITLDLHQGASTFTASTNVILAGETSVTFNGLTLDAAGKNHQFYADTTGGSSSWQPGVSEAFTVLDDQPGTNANGITFEEVGSTYVRISYTETNAPEGVIVVVKANSLLDADELPIDGTTYVGNSIYGAGSNLGAASIVLNDQNSAGGVTVTGLAPNTTYYFYVFQYNFNTGEKGTENYKTTAAAQNPNSTTTLGGTDDDVAFGSNGTFATSKTIGTNTPVKGLITDASDEDWFNFTVTSASANLRTQLSDLPANYNIEVYDLDGNLLRRGIRMSTGTESPVVNNLPAGTYVVRIYGYNGAFDATRTYTLQVTTRGDEIFSVTP